MNKLTKVMALLLALVMVMSMFAGCGAKTEESAAEEENAASEESASTEEAEEAETAEETEEAAAEEGAAMDNDIVVVMSADITSFDPTASASLWSSYVLLMTYDRLFETDENNSPYPHLAKSYEFASDTECVITLQEGALFSDGSPITANDVKASLDRAIASGMGGALYTPLKGVEVVDDLTVKVITDGLYPQLTTALSHPISCIMPAAYLEEAEASGDWSNPVCSGRYTVEERVPGESIKLIPNPNFWDTETAPKNDSLTFRVVPEASTRTIMVQTGEADLNAEFSSADYEIASADPNVAIHEYDGAVMKFMTLDSQHEALSNKLVRQAINYAVDRESVLLVQANGYGYVNYSYIAKACYGWLDNPAGYSYNPEKAKELLAEAGYADGFEMDLWVTSDYNAAATLIQSNLADVGITVNIQAMESLDMIVSLATDGELDSCITIWGCYTDPTLFLERNLGESALGAYNQARYVNPELEELWAEGRAYPEVEDRIPVYEQWQEILCEDAAWCPLYVDKIFVVANAGLQGVQINIEQAYGFHTLTY